MGPCPLVPLHIPHTGILRMPPRPLKSLRGTRLLRPAGAGVCALPKPSSYIGIFPLQLLEFYAILILQHKFNKMQTRVCFLFFGKNIGYISYACLYECEFVLQQNCLCFSCTAHCCAFFITGRHDCRQTSHYAKRYPDGIPFCVGFYLCTLPEPSPCIRVSTSARLIML